MELARVEIQNFQSHSKTIIAPAPVRSLTVITRPSDSGKTAVVRALKWLLYNQPQGDSFRRIGCEFVEVSAETTAGQHVTRRRTSTTNRYIVDGQILEGFGSSVPLEAQQATGVRPVRLADQDILANIAGQLEPPFLGSSISAPARAKVLGKLAGTEVIDHASRELGTDLHRLRQEAKRLEAEAGELEEEIARYDHLPKLAETIEQLRVLASAIRANEGRIKKLVPLKGRLQAIEVQREIQEQTIRLAGKPEAALAHWTEASACAARRERLSLLAGRLRGVRQDMAQARLTLGETAGAEDALKSHEKAQAASHRLIQLRKLSNALLGVTQAQELLTEQLADASAASSVTLPTDKVNRLSQLRLAAKQLEELRLKKERLLGTKELAEMTLDKAAAQYRDALIEAGKCPLCGSEVQDDCLKEVLSA